MRGTSPSINSRHRCLTYCTSCLGCQFLTPTMMSRPFSWRQTKLTNGPGTPPGGILVAYRVAIGLVTCTGSNHPTRVYIYYPPTNRSAFPPHSFYVKCRYSLKNRTAPEMRCSTSSASRFSLSHCQTFLNQDYLPNSVLSHFYR